MSAPSSAKRAIRASASSMPWVGRIAMFAAEGADMLFLDSPSDEDEMQRAVAAAGGRPSFTVFAPDGPPPTPTRDRAAALGFKLGTEPTALISPAIAAMQAGLAALAAGTPAGGLPAATLRATLGYDDYEEQAARFRTR